jgi:hypothetical protein
VSGSLDDRVEKGGAFYIRKDKNLNGILGIPPFLSNEPGTEDRVTEILYLTLFAGNVEIYLKSLVV